MKLRVYVSIIAFGAMMLSMLNHSMAAADTDNTNLLFVVSAKSASIKALPEKPGQFQLTLQGVNPKATYFSDRPKREAGRMDLTTLVRQWQPGQAFAKTPPNASLHVEANQKAMTYTIELTQAKYDTESDRLIFEVVGLPGGRTIEIKKKMKNVSLFVDQWCPQCSL